MSRNLELEVIWIITTLQDALFFPGRLMNRWRSDEDHSVSCHPCWGQKPGDLLQVLWVLLHWDMLLRIFICTAATERLCMISFFMKAPICKDEFNDLGQEVSELNCTFQWTVIGSKKHSNSSYIVVCWLLAADKARQDYFSPSGVISRKSSVNYIAFSKDKT